jgi:hypothetical protein
MNGFRRFKDASFNLFPGEALNEFVRDPSEGIALAISSEMMAVHGAGKIAETIYFHDVIRSWD